MRIFLLVIIFFFTFDIHSFANDLEKEFNQSINKEKEIKEKYNRFCKSIINQGKILAKNKHDTYTDYGPPRKYGMESVTNKKGVWDPKRGEYVFESETDYTIFWEDKNGSKLISVIKTYPKVFDKPCVFVTGYLIGEGNWKWDSLKNYALHIDKPYKTRKGEIILNLSKSGDHLVVYLRHNAQYAKEFGNMSRCQYSFDVYNGTLTHWSEFQSHNECDFRDMYDVSPYNEWENLKTGKNNPWKSF